MKVLIDENIPKMTVEALLQRGHDVLDIRGTEREGIADSELWQIAQSEDRLLVTTDKWFAHHRMERHAGVLIILCRKPNRKKIHDRIISAFDQFGDPEWQDLIVIMRDCVQSIWRSRH